MEGEKHWGEGTTGVISYRSREWSIIAFFPGISFVKLCIVGWAGLPGGFRMRIMHAHVYK